ncbi:MAG: SDR family oxidoreductase [Prochloraceae cyanobacterium]|nr:SDR family oxidoreductase [Prochloraceae cyanobacterium]
MSKSIGRLEGKVALITGGGSGIGRSSALAFAREGAKVAIADLSPEAGEDTVKLIQQANGEAIFVKTNVANATEVRALIKKVVAVYGSIDCAFNNAGIEGNKSSAVACSEQNWERVIDVNLKGIWLCMKSQIPYMREQRGGSIVNMASVAGLRSGLPRLSIYTASKHGVVGLTKAAAVEYARAGIRINAICPGFIQTPMLERDEETFSQLKASIETLVPAGRLGTPEEVAEAVVWLSSDAASFVNGHAMVVDGGYTTR